MKKDSLYGTNKIAFYADYINGLGINSELVFENTDLNIDAVNTDLFKATPEQYRTIIGNIIRLTKDPFIGITLGNAFKINHFGLLGYAALSSSTLRQSREVIAKYYMLNEQIITPTVLIDNEQWRIELKEWFPLGNLISFAVEEYVSRAIELALNLTNKAIPIIAMHLTYPEPEDMSAYIKHFNCPILFNQPKNLIFFDVNRIDDPISHANEEVFKVCESQCRNIASRVTKETQLSGAIKQILVNAPGKFPSMEEMSKILNMNCRTMRRKLLNEGTTYSTISYEFRKDLAIDYLEHTSLSPKEIGFLIGFTSVSNFRRSFKIWTGKKLSDYRSKK